MEEKKYFVYCHIFPNGKKYVGITGYKNPKYRWMKDGKGYKTQVLYLAIQKYGWDNVKHRILIHGLTKEQAERWEIKIISYYHLTDKKFGYNIANGGSCSDSYTEATRKKMSLNNKSRRKIICLNNRKVYNCIKEASDMLQVNRSTISHICMNNNRNKMVKGFGFYYYDEFMKLTLEEQNDLINKFFDYRNSYFVEDRRCVCLETGKYYEGVVHAGKETGIYQMDISACCKHKMKHAKNFHWLFADEYERLTEKEIFYIINAYKVICLETLEVFNGVTVAGKKYNMHWGAISSQCKNMGKDFRKKHDYHFMYYLDYLKLTQS